MNQVPHFLWVATFFWPPTVKLGNNRSIVHLNILEIEISRQERILSFTRISHLPIKNRKASMLDCLDGPCKMAENLKT